LLEDDDVVGVRNRGELVGDDHHLAGGRDVFERRLDALRRDRVELVRGFVADEDVRVAEKGAG
jgi:hypothetical protein